MANASCLLGGEPGSTGKNESCRVCISEVRYGLARSQASDTQANDYVPAAMFCGSAGVVSENPEEPCYTADNTPLLVLNALNGSVIPMGQQAAVFCE